MKNTIIKSVLALVMVFMVLPMMGQDFMNIYFKDGRHHKFYLRDIKSISTSKYDAEGVMHGDYEFQHITTLENQYVYNLFDIDSIYFSKYNEELALKNISSACLTIFPSLEECTTIEDAEKQIGVIEKADGVEKVWSDGKNLHVKISDWETMSFHFSHNEEDDSMPNIESLKKLMSTSLGTVFSPNGNYKRAVIANQQQYDEKFNRPFLYYLKESFEKCGIIVDYPKDPTLDFFWNNSEDPQNLNLYDYDIIFLLTHGGYDDVTGTHGLMAADYLGYELVHWTKPVSSYKVEWKDRLDELRKKYKEVTDDDVKLNWSLEFRDAIPYWIAYPVILESFFDKAEGQFTNENSIWFNCACSSLAGNESEGGASSSMADKFLYKNLGIYLGYAKPNSSGGKTGYNFFTNMLSGQSLIVALRGAIPFISIDELKEILDGSRTSTVLTATNPSKGEKNSMTLFPSITKKVDQQTATNSFNKSNYVEVEGYATSINYNNLSSIGFLYGTDEKLSSSQMITDVEIIEFTKPLDNGNGNISFRGKITDLTPGTNYYYCAFTYDGMYYNCGDTCSFIVHPPLTLSVNNITIEEGTSSTIDITSGSGSYSIEKIEPEGVVTASISENHISIEALTSGSAIITVKDDKSGQTATIEVKVSANEPYFETETFTVNGVSFKMVAVEGGTFMMGAPDSDDTAADYEKPQHQVTLNDYYIGQTEVTQELWEAVMGSNPSYFRGSKQFPVEQVSWYDCREFLSKLNNLTGKNFRLPTEAEWEYAAQGGNRSKGYTFSGSNEVNDVAWYLGNSDNTIHAVATKKPNELGIYDMSGNVWEWCRDLWGDYSSEKQVNPTGATSGSKLVLRSGSWNFSDFFCRSKHRNSDTPDHTASHLGLRLALPGVTQEPCPAKIVGVELTSTEYHRNNTNPNEMYFSINASLDDLTDVEEWGIYFDDRPGIYSFPFETLETNQTANLYYSSKEGGIMEIDLNSYVVQLEDEVGAYVKKRNKSTGELITIFGDKFRFQLRYDTKPSMIISNPQIASTKFTGYKDGVKLYETTITYQYDLKGAFWVSYVNSGTSEGWFFNETNDDYWYPEKDGSGEAMWIATYEAYTENMSHTNWRILHLRNNQTVNSNYVNFTGDETITNAWVSSTPMYAPAIGESKRIKAADRGSHSLMSHYMSDEMGKGTYIPVEKRKEFPYKDGVIGIYCP